MCINTFKNKLGRALAGFLCIVLLAGGMIQTVYADEAYSSYISLPPVKLDLKGSYFSYIQKYQSEKHPEQPIVIKASGDTAALIIVLKRQPTPCKQARAVMLNGSLM